MSNINSGQENRAQQCRETAEKLIRAVYDEDGAVLLSLLSQGSRLSLESRGVPPDGASLPALAQTIRRAWNCPLPRVQVLGADFDHPHLQGRVRVPVILDHQNCIPEGHVLRDGDPLPSSCGALCVLLIREGGEWKVDNIAELAPGSC